jgi:hypothetical protein
MEEQLQHTHLDGIVDYIAALDTLCGLARRSLYIFEKDFENIGFDSEARYDTLRAFLLSSPANELHLLAHDPRPMTLYCPRLLLLLRQFGHNMRIYRTPPHLLHISDPFAVADDAHYVRRFHFDDPRGIFAQHDTEGARVLKARFVEMWSASRQAISTTTLGL